MSILKYLVPMMGVGTLMMLSACSSPAISTYTGNKPEFKPEHFFQGNLTAHGVIKNRSGEVIRWFNADLRGEWHDGTLLLEEQFVFNDGENQTRTWKLQATGEKNGVATYTGTANDVKGQAKAKATGNAFFMKYTLLVPYKSKTLAVEVDDQLYRVSEDTLINHSSMSKFGIKVGEIVLTIQKAD